MMRQLVQSVRSGELRIVEAPDPIIDPTQVLVQTSHSVISAGTERAVHQLASSSLLSKARARPDLVRKVIDKARRDGIRNALNSVQSRLDEDMPLGYSGAGIVVEVGAHVEGVRPGMRVATGGAGHSDLQVVSGRLAVPIPEAVEDSAAAFATVASIGLHALRLAEVGPGARICVLGLGLIGQLTTRLALAAGIEVVGIDLRDWTVKRATASGAFGLVESGESTTYAVREWSRGRGVDAVLVTAATASSEPMNRAAELARDRATIVVVGDVGLNLQRTPLYDRELTIKVARSYGPGRYERSYEEWGVDYPIGHVRWTEGRNLEAVLDLLANKRLAFSDLVTHTFEFDKAIDAYSLLDQADASYLGIQLKYPAVRTQAKPHIRTATQATSNSAPYRIGLIGAGNFARDVLVPSIKTAAIGEITLVASAGGASAAKLADNIGAQAVSTDQLLADESINLVVIASSHDSHADLTIRALEAGKNVFCEKPLALTFAELERVHDTWQRSGKLLTVGFNRRYSHWIQEIRDRLPRHAGPISVSYRVAAQSLPAEHWYNDRRQGGKLIGEVCHFIDTCHAIVGEDCISVEAMSSSEGEAQLSENFVVQMRFSDGSLASILYASRGHASTPKERVDVLGGGHTLVLDDFRILTHNKRRIAGSYDKGHVAQFAALLQAPPNMMQRRQPNWHESTRISLLAVSSLFRK